MTSTSSSTSNFNFTQNVIHEVKKFYQNTHQLNILLQETNNACKELKILQQSSTTLTENIEVLQMNQNDDKLIKALSSMKICFVIFGQNVLTKSILVNELLSRYLLPFQLSNDLKDEHWRFIKIKYGKLSSYTFQLVDSEFELMSPEHMNKKFAFSGSTPPNNNSSFLNNNSYASSENSFGKSEENFTKSSTETSPTGKNSSKYIHSTSPVNISNTSVLSSSSFTIPIEDLRLDSSLVEARESIKLAKTATELHEAKQKLERAESIAENLAILEITLDNRLLENNVEFIVYSNSMQKSIFENLAQNAIPIYLYGIIDNKLNEQDIKELQDLKKLINNHPVLFVKIPEIEKYLQQLSCQQNISSSPPNKSQTELNTSFSNSIKITPVQTQLTNSFSQQQIQLKRAGNFLKYLLNSSQMQSNKNSNTFTIFSQLCDLKFMSIIPSTNNYTLPEETYSYLIDCSSSYSFLSLPQPWSHVSNLVEGELCEKWHLFLPTFSQFLKKYLKSFSIRGTSILSKFHEYCLSKFINFAYEMARDMMITPKKIEYAREKEQILFESLNSLASMKQEELKNLINNAIESNREQILEASKNFEFVDIELISYNDSESLNSTSISNTSGIANINDSSSSLTDSSSVKSLNEGTSNNNNNSISNYSSSKKIITVKYARDYKKCTNQIQELVINKINNVIGQKLTQSVEILKENYLGTLKRCLKTLEDMNNLNGNDQNSASVSEALQQILNAAYQVEINISASSNILKILIQRMKEMFNNMPWSASPKLDEEWKVTTAANMLNSLSESKLARILCNQMRERLESSHKHFTTSLKILEEKHTGRLERTEEKQNLIRKILAPKFAKLCLESTSLKDYVSHGFPALSKEIGRGQYGVVYGCHKWGKYENLAVKSVVPPDEKHWNDLALEFHYTKQIPEHERIVKLIGSVIDYTYGNGQSPAVLLIMEAMKRDLYTGLKAGIDWKSRIKISLDVVDGIRYLHSLGLVHRDIKLKNVLLDANNRAKITDLGFCKPEAMMSGSIVGTPVHMCPEMFNSKYDSSVDIYAFGILFWYICSGAVALPKNFEECSSKDELWSSVKRGVRPERLSTFDDDCWNLMEVCWSHDPKARPHIGVVSHCLKKINDNYETF